MIELRVLAIVHDGIDTYCLWIGRSGESGAFLNGHQVTLPPHPDGTPESAVIRAFRAAVDAAATVTTQTTQSQNGGF